MPSLLELLDEGGLSLAAAGARLGFTEGECLAILAEAGRSHRVDGLVALKTVQQWGRVRLILRSRSSVAEVMTDLGNVREAGGWWNDEDERVHLHLDTRDVHGAFVTTKAGHLAGRTVRIVAFVDADGEVLFKVMLPKERTDLIAAFSALKGVE